MKQLELKPSNRRAAEGASNKFIRLAELEGVRALAALWVFGFHVWQFGGSPECRVVFAGREWDALWFLKQGPSGVDLFMVLSGLCLFFPVVSRKDGGEGWNWWDYFKRRIRRIVPAYYAAIAYAVCLPMVLVGLVRILGWEARMQPVPSWWQIATHLAFAHTLFQETWDGITGAFWSMGLEAQFYLTFPLLVWAWTRYRWWALWATIAASIFYRAMVDWGLPPDADSGRFLCSITFLGRWMQFAAGMLVSALLVLRPPGRIAKSPAAVPWIAGGGIACVLLGLCSAVSDVRVVPLRDVFLSAGYGSLLYALLTVPWRWRSLLSSGPLAKLGVFSYSFFLIHQPTAWYFMEWMRKRAGFSGVSQVAMGLSVGLILTAAVSLGFAWLFEGEAVRGRLRRAKAPERRRPASALSKVETV